MKVSIIIPTNNEEKYIADILQFIRANTRSENIEDIIIVDAFNRKNLVKVAEKEHAKLYMVRNADYHFCLDAGAFESKGDILYFIKPGCFPPSNFDERIIHAVKTKYLTGGFLVKTKNGNFFQRMVCMFINCGFSFSQIGNNSFFITRGLFHGLNGFRQRNSWNNLSELIERASYFSRFKIIPDYLTTSSSKVD
jgi:glycosyltransferase involved in cell wall biosynthesis